MSPNEEIISIIRYAPGPIDASSIYDKCKSIENIKDVSSRLSQLYNQGKLARTEIVTSNNRKGFAYSIPQKIAATNDDALPVIPDLPLPDSTAAASAPEEPKTQREKGKVEAAFRRAEKSAARELAPSDASLADAILAESRRQLIPKWTIDQDGAVRIFNSDGFGVLLSPTQACVMAEMVLVTHEVLEKLA